MSTERYEIKGKIGEGGVGAVYHAYDTHLNRDVAIKRVLADGGYEDQEDATKSLLKEATALSSVQHPHIVTVYDAGIDDDGPYVVMELIHGRTLDEMVERATMTWDDIREVALQSQEALIAAQDLDLVHRDLKPSNLMVCWLPSGKFQVKIVDFGLAKFSAAPSLQTIAHGDAVFGSIFFMAPEQFERIPLDKCTDMYSMGCLYYFALTGEYPFNGETAAMVMASHLQHHVTPLHELRPDIPKWGADWIMWHMEREMQNRPQDAREALGRFLQMDQQSTQPVTVSAGGAPTPSTGAQMIFPGTAAQTAAATATTPATAAHPINPLTAQQPIAPPSGTLNVHTATQAVMAQSSQTATGPMGATTGVQTAQPTTGPQGGGATAPIPEQPAEATKGLPPVAKWTIIGLLTLVIAVIIAIYAAQSDKRQQAKDYKAAMELAAAAEADGTISQGLTLTEPQLRAVLLESSKMEDNKKRVIQRKTLAFAQGSGYDPDPIITEFVINTAMTTSIRNDFFEQVIRRRKHAESIPLLLQFAVETKESSSAAAAIDAAESAIKDNNSEIYFDEFLDLINSADSSDIRIAAERALSLIIETSKNKQVHSKAIYSSYSSAIEPAAKYTLLRLLASTGSEQAAKATNKALNSSDKTLQSAAIAAMGRWGNDDQFDNLNDFIAETDSDQLRKTAFDAAVNFLNIDRERDSDDLGDLWRTLASNAKLQKEKLKVIRGLGNERHAWAAMILDRFIQDKDDLVIDRAEQAKERVETRIKKGDE